MKPENSLIPALLLSGLSMLTMSGCASQAQRMAQQDYPLAYTEGFDDGCHSGNKAGGSLFDQFKKDTRRFEVDHQYAQGWSDGFRQCESEQESIQRQTRIGIEQQKLIEQRRQSQLQQKYQLENQAVKGIDTSNLKDLK